MFIDEAVIHLKAGDGGRGCVSFRREMHVPRGGPDGGNGGRGGSIFFLADPHVNTLMDVSQRASYVADSGLAGSGHLRHGKAGRDVTIHVPVGTIVHDIDRAIILKDLDTEGQSICIVKGGQGGFGNKHFATATHQTPTEAGPGEPGQQRNIRLELKLVADVGLVGLPNSGKSTLLSRLSAARPKIADYPFTTLHPQLGIVEGPNMARFVLADIPGLIEGAHLGVGLGDEFLRHIARTRLILHLVDAAPPEGTPTPDVAYSQVRRELESYSDALAKRPEIVVVTKMDLTEAPEGLRLLQKIVPGPVYAISAVTGQGLRELVIAVLDFLRNLESGDDSTAN